MPPPANGRSCAIWRQSTAASCGRFSRPANWSKARSTKSRRVAATRVAATRLDLVDRAFDQFAGLENLPPDRAGPAGGGWRHREQTRASSWLWSQSNHRIKLTLSRRISTVHDLFLKVQRKMWEARSFFESCLRSE